MTTRAFVSIELQNIGHHPNCACLADYPMQLSPAVLDDFWHRYGINVFSLALPGLYQNVVLHESDLITLGSQRMIIDRSSRMDYRKERDE